MNYTTSNTVKVGLIVAIALAGLMGMIFAISQHEQPFWESQTRYEIRLARSGGLQTGAFVTIDGVQVGTVSDVHLPLDLDAKFIQVFIKVPSQNAPRVRENSVATVKTIGLLGDKYVFIKSGTEEAEPIPPLGIIPSEDSTDYEAVVGDILVSLRAVANKVDHGEGTVAKLLNDPSLYNSVDGVATSVRAVADKVNNGDGTIGKLVNDPAIHDNLRDITNKVNKGDGTLSKLLNDPTIHKNMKDITDKINHGDGTLGLLLNDRTLYDNATGATDTIHRSRLLNLFGLKGKDKDKEKKGKDDKK